MMRRVPLCDIRSQSTGHRFKYIRVVRQVIKLSDAVQVLPRQATQFVHGAPGSFLAIGDEKAQVPAGELHSLQDEERSRPVKAPLEPV